MLKDGIDGNSARKISPLDRLLSQALLSIIEEKLGNKTCQKIESRLRQRYGLTLAESVQEFHILDATLREIFGAGADAVEADFLEHVMSLARVQQPGSSRSWIKMKDLNLIRVIFTSYGDTVKRKILDTVIRQPSTISEILRVCMIPKSSGYRMINEMLDTGLLFEDGNAKTSDGKRVCTYGALFERIKIDVESKNDSNASASVQVLVKEDVMMGSQIVRILDRRDSLNEEG